MKTCPSCKRHVRLGHEVCPFCGSAVRTITALTVLASVGLAAAVVGCGPAVDAQSGTSGADGTGGVTSSTTTEEPASTGTSRGTSGETDADTTSVDASTAAVSTGGTDTSSDGGFIDDTISGGGVYGVECSIWDQDCGRGEKCVPWANDGSSVLNASICRPIHPQPRAAGEPCRVEEGVASGIDDCDALSVCFDVDPDTLEGVCAAFCEGDENAPTCEAKAQHCVISNEGVVTLCLDTCDPFGAPCDDERSCVAAEPDRFVCVRPDAIPLGEPCFGVATCEEGASCVAVSDGDARCVLPCVPDGDPCEAGSSCAPWGDAGVCLPDA
ncbi:MAG: hypothetical protein AAGA54_34275 [Myxococcota bacterium]